MTRVVVVSALAAWIGLSLVFAEVRWFTRRSMVERLRPYLGGAESSTGGFWTAASFRAALVPMLQRFGERLSSLLGQREPLEQRLERTHSTIDPAAFRLRQLWYSLAAFMGGLVVAVIARTPPPLTLFFLVGAPLLAFLAIEQQAVGASDRWKRHVHQELPVIAEQLAMLVSSGLSLGSSLQRVATRGHGACARDLERVCRRIRHGVSEVVALREWRDIALVPAVDRLVAVLALNRDATDLGRLLGEEARAIRRDAQRVLIESIDRRAQQVWIPVTVAALIPGSIFIAVPFIEALRLFGE